MYLGTLAYRKKHANVQCRRGCKRLRLNDNCSCSRTHATACKYNI